MSNKNDKNNKNNKLGSTLFKSKNKKFGRNFNEQTIQMFTTDIDAKEERRKLYSNTDTGNNLENFLELTSLEQKVFEIEKQNVVVITKSSSTVLSPEERLQKTMDHQKIQEKNKKFWNSLTIPRRPHWDQSTTAEELKDRERESFYQWRKSIAILEEKEGLLVTPFEKNPEVWKQLWRVAEKSDILIQIVDGRNPLLFRSPDLEKYAKEINPKKHNLLLVNKADLLTKPQRRKWAKYFDSEGVNYRFFSAYKEQIRIEKEKQDNKLLDLELLEKKLIKHQELKPNVEEEEEITEEQEDNIEQNTTTTTTNNININNNNKKETEEELKIKIYNREELIEEFKKICPSPIEDNPRFEGRIVVGLSGYPNVGKSSTINVLFGEKKVAVAPTPGKTKYIQTLLIDSELVLLDCPGLVFPTLTSSKADMVCNGLLPIDQLRDFISPVDLITERFPREYLEEFYSIGIPKPQDFEDQKRAPTANEFLGAYGYMRGFKTVHGAPDASRAARIILKDYVNGKLLYCFPPPGLDSLKFQRKSLKSAKSTSTTTTTDNNNNNNNDENVNQDEEETSVPKDKKVTYDYVKENEAQYSYQEGVLALTKDARKKKTLPKKKNMNSNLQEQLKEEQTGFTRTKFKHNTESVGTRAQKIQEKKDELRKQIENMIQAKTSTTTTSTTTSN